jgi:hypothetical protein
MKKKNSFFCEGYYPIFCRITRKLRKKDFVDAESFADRDKVCRVFAAECFELARHFAKIGNEKFSLQYAKLAARLLGLSLRPKKMSDLDEIKKALAKLKAESGE